MTRTIAHLLVLLLTGLLVGCTSASAGDPRPAADSTPTSEGETRPREIRLDDVDPCTLLPEADYGDFYLDEPGQPEQDDRGADGCLWLGEVGYMGATLVTYEGVEAQEGRSGAVEPAEPIEGFPAYTIKLPDRENPCFVAVDVADGQYLNVQVGLDSSRDGVPPACDYAHQFASSVMSTLVAS